MGRGVWVPAFAGTTSDKLNRAVPLLRCGGSWAADIAGRVPKPLDHHRGQVLFLIGHAGAGAHGVAVLVREMSRPLSLLQRAGALHHQFAEMHDAEIGRAEMLAGTVGDRTLAVLDRGVLFGHALD